MHPTTVILILGLNLAVIGGLLAMIGRRMDDAQGMRGFATGSAVFGVAYLVRLGLGHNATGLASVLPDTAMVFAMLCFATGLRQFSGQPPLGRRTFILCPALFALVWLVATLTWSDVGRHAVLNGGLGLGYLWLGALALQAARRDGGALRVPLQFLGVTIGLLGVLTVVRCMVAVSVGVPPLFEGLAAQVFYGYATLVTVVLGPNLLWMVFMRLNDRLSRLATHDPLTGLLNRNGLEEALQRHFGTRPTRTLVLCQLDIDHFKRVNDQHGHATGDAVLQGVARILAEQVRGGDFVARLGGEEFLVGCSSADPAQAAAEAVALAERLRSAVARHPHRLADREDADHCLRCSVSIGVSRPLADRSGWETGLREADAALYAAKRAGRDRVVAASDPLAMPALQADARPAVTS